jgi:LEA14-like dessication related protein
MKLAGSCRQQALTRASGHDGASVSRRGAVPPATTILASSLRTRFLAACAALLVASACTSGRPKIEPPVITLESVRVGRVANAKADVSLKVVLANKNDFELAIDRVEFDIALDSRQAITGRSVHIDPLPPGGETKVDLAGRVDAAAVATALMTLGSQLPVPYVVNGTLTLKNGTALAFSRKGEIPIMRFDGALGSRP